MAQFVQPFNILGDRLFRIRLLRDKENIYLLQDIHHIISDGASRRVLLADIEKAYQPLDPSYPKERLNFMMRMTSLERQASQ